MAVSDLFDSLSGEFPNTVVQRQKTHTLKDSYKNVSWIYAAVNLIADSISGVEFFFGRKDSLGNINRLEDRVEPVVYCFYPPRYGEIPTMAEMIKMMFLHLGLFGEAFLLLEKKGKFPVEIDVINPLNITPNVSKDGRNVESWRVTRQLPGGTTETKNYKPSDIVQWKYPNPYNKFRGMAPLSAARLPIEQELNMSVWNAGFFQNGIRNPIALMLKQSLNDPQRREYMKRLRENFTGFVKGQLPLLVEGGVDVRVLSNTVKDLDFVQGKELTREEIAAVYGTPPALVGIYRFANYANVKEQTRIFYNAALKPKMTYFRDLFQQSICDVHFPGVICDWEWESVDAFREDPTITSGVRAAEASTAKVYWDMGYTTTQIAYILKNPDLDPSTHTSLTPKLPEIPEPEVPKGMRPRFSMSKSHTVIYASKEMLAEYATSVKDGVIRQAETRLSSFASSFLGQFRRSIKKATPEFWAKTWVDGVRPIMGTLYAAGVESAYIDTRSNGYSPVEISVEQLDPVINIGNLVIDGLLSSGIKDDKKLKDAVESILEKLPLGAVVQKVYNDARFATLKILNVEDVAWACAGDKHDDLHGSVVKIGEVFESVGVRHPGELWKDSCCSCTLYPISIKREEKKVVITA